MPADFLKWGLKPAGGLASSRIPPHGVQYNGAKEDLADAIHRGILGYFASVDGADRLAARSSKTIVNYRMPSYGGFSATAQPLYWFGIPRNVRFPGVTMDVDYLHTQAAAKDADNQKRIAYLRQTGAAGSAFEHAVPEKLFVDPSTCNAPGTPTPDPNKPACPQGVSAVKAIAIAAQQGQKVYTLNQANQSLHAALLSQVSIEAEARQEIQYALAAGLEVTVHQLPITVSGWTGSGYIIVDKVSGAGAYKISGGANGGLILVATGATLLILAALGMLDGTIIPAMLPVFALFAEVGVLFIAAGVALMQGYISVCVAAMLQALSILAQIIRLFFPAPWMRSFVETLLVLPGVTSAELVCNR